MPERSHQKTVLIVEDDVRTAKLVALYLEREGYRVRTAANGPEAIRIAEQISPCLVILDLMLPKMNGWEVCRQLRKSSDVPVIMLTARGDEIDRVAGLSMGADDYVVKPFSPRELVARVQAVLRRSGLREQNDKNAYTHGDLVLDTTRRRLTRNSRSIDLTPHEYALLQALMEQPGRVFTRDELIDRIYPRGEALVIDRVVDVHIGKLRQKIEPDPTIPRFILTVRGTGYRFADPDEGLP